MGRKREIHWCWCCQRHLANERFSGRGHARHLCRECSRLPAEERNYRQAVLDIERVLSRAGKWRKELTQLDGYREHPDERVRRFLANVLHPPVEEEPAWTSERDRASPLQEPGDPRPLPLIDDGIPF